ncbi:enoyl-CoA hydratase/isomerase family protein [Streptomyces sp. NPDC005407]|uniref:enoyl-CoA hydratase/isomerase family protein n=1 Tax=Streptomyces sp. NPDC005407 TaxID=3155340 RepID=UPI0033BA191B
MIVVQSADPDFFAAHVDLSFMLKPETFAELANPSAGTGGDESLLNPMQKLMLRFRTLPQVTIAKLAGRLRGGGNELAMALDMRFAAKGRTWLAQPETRMGIIPGGGGTQLLPPLVGRARALEVILSGNLLDAEVAERYGWINRALPPEGLDGFVDELARRVATLRPEQIAAAQGGGRSRIDQRRAPAGRARQGKQSARRGVPRSGRGGRAHARRRGGRRTDPRRRTRPGGFAGPRSSVGSRAC